MKHAQANTWQRIPILRVRALPIQLWYFPTKRELKKKNRESDLYDEHNWEKTLYKN